MDVKLEKEVARELVTFKLQHVQKTIRIILEKWKEENTDDFITKAKNGILENAKLDAISIRQLVPDYKKFKELLDSINSAW